MVSKDSSLPDSVTHPSSLIRRADEALDWFSKDNATSNDDVIMRGVVWIRLPVPMLTLPGQGRVSFTTAIPLFSRRGHNVWIFVLFSSWKGKKNYPYM